MSDLESRIAELEEFTRRVIPAREGADGWANWIESRLREERRFSHEVVAHALALARNEILDTARAAIDQALTRRVCGTHDPQSKYSALDIVAKDGGSFIARRDAPGPCPGDGWQLMAKQGQRGVAGPRGERGPPGNIITGWIVDRSVFRVTPRMSDGTLGPPLELRELFEPSIGLTNL
jgi:hypothetical protein